MLSRKTWQFLIFFSCYLTVTVKAIAISEAEQISLETSGELLPPPSLVERIEKDLKAIRSQYEVVANVGHTPKWVAGQLIISGATEGTLNAINKSKYGPIESRVLSSQSQIYLITFMKPYNPEKLAELLKKELGISGGEPNGIIGGSSSITMTCDQSGNNTYVFFIGSGDCQAGCIDRRYITFTVSPNQTVQFVSDTGEGSGSVESKDKPVGVGMF